MLSIKASELKLTSQGYHFDEHGKKFIRIFTSLSFVKIQIKIQPHKTMHIKSISADFPYNITDYWVEITFPYQKIKKIANPWFSVDAYIDERCKEVWFD